MSISVTLEGGLSARILELDGERVALSSERAFAPGSRFEGAALGRVVRVKVHRSVKIDEGFRIEGRLIDLTRSMRIALTEALSVPEVSVPEVSVPEVSDPEASGS